jgi:hypothetical protein
VCAALGTAAEHRRTNDNAVVILYKFGIYIFPNMPTTAEQKLK